MSDVPAGAESEPRWISRALLDAMHDVLVDLHGGLRGVSSEHLVESALARPRTAFHYGGADVVACAAAHAFELPKKNDGYRDGNKRTAFAAAATLLKLNGLEVDADEREVVEAMVLLATERVNEL